MSTMIHTSRGLQLLDTDLYEIERMEDKWDDVISICF